MLGKQLAQRRDLSELVFELSLFANQRKATFLFLKISPLIFTPLSVPRLAVWCEWEVYSLPLFWLFRPLQSSRSSPCNAQSLVRSQWAEAQPPAASLGKRQGSALSLSSHKLSGLMVGKLERQTRYFGTLEMRSRDLCKPEILDSQRLGKWLLLGCCKTWETFLWRVERPKLWLYLAFVLYLIATYDLWVY